MKKKLNTIINETIIFDIFVIMLGLFLICNPLLTTSVANVLIGIFLIISGLYMISKFIINMDKNRYFTYQLFFGLLSSIIGIIFLINPLLLSSIITIIIGIWTIISGIIKLTLSIRFKMFNEESWLINMVISIFSIIVGILLIVNPFKGSIVISTYIGIMISLYAGMDIVEKMIMKKRLNEIEKIIFNK